MSYSKMLGKPSLPSTSHQDFEPRTASGSGPFPHALRDRADPLWKPKKMLAHPPGTGPVVLQFGADLRSTAGFAGNVQSDLWRFFLTQKKNRDMNHLLWFQKPQKTIQMNTNEADHTWYTYIYVYIYIYLFIYIMYRKRCFFKAFILDTPSWLLWTRTLRVRDDLMWAVLAKQSTCPASFHRRSHFHDHRDGTSRWVSLPKHGWVLGKKNI